MCVIIHLPAGTMIDKDHLFNAVYNNWHSWGIVLKDGNGKLQMLKDCPEKENNPEVIWKTLEDNKDIERALHVRHTTKGSTDIENAQPFEVYNSDARQVFFMHNGTLAKFGSTSNYNYHQNQNVKSISDTREFCEKVISPSLLRWYGERGKADYTDKHYWELVLKEPWSFNSKGLFISNDLDILCIGDGWKKYKGPDGVETEIRVSNDDYFARVTRGPEFDRREAERRAKLAEAQTTFQDLDTPWIKDGETSTTTESAIKVYRPTHLEKSKLVMNALNHLHEDLNWNDHGQVAQTFYMMTLEELIDFLGEESIFTTAALFSRLSDALHDMWMEKEDLRKRNVRLEKRLTEIHIEGKNKAA